MRWGCYIPNAEVNVKLETFRALRSQSGAHSRPTQTFDEVLLDRANPIPPVNCGKFCRGETETALDSSVCSL